MPVLTRSQSKTGYSIQENPQQTSTKKYMYINKSLEDWFDLILEKYNNEIKRLKQERGAKLIQKRRVGDGGLVVHSSRWMHRKHDHMSRAYTHKLNVHYEYFCENMRLTNELFYIIEEYFPSIYLTNYNYKELLPTINNNIKLMYSKIRLLYSVIIPLNKEDVYLIKTTLKQLQTTENALACCLTNETEETYSYKYSDVGCQLLGENKYGTQTLKQNTHIRFADDY